MTKRVPCTPLPVQVALSALHADERAEVLRCCTRRMPLARCVDLDAVAGRLRGYVAADVAAVACEAALAAAVEAVRAAEEAGQPEAVESPGFLAGLRVTAAHFEAAAAAAGPSVLRGLTPDIPDVSFEDIGGLEVRRCWDVGAGAGGGGCGSGLSALLHFSQVLISC